MKTESIRIIIENDSNTNDLFLYTVNTGELHKRYYQTIKDLFLTHKQYPRPEPLESLLLEIGRYFRTGLRHYEKDFGSYDSEGETKENVVGTCTILYYNQLNNEYKVNGLQ
jgi:hypothetical protein